jgi:hypothetical protein
MKLWEQQAEGNRSIRTACAPKIRRAPKGVTVYYILYHTHFCMYVECYIWSIDLYGDDTWTLRKVDQKYLESFEMWCWRRMEKISWSDRVRN